MPVSRHFASTTLQSQRTFQKVMKHSLFVGSSISILGILFFHSYWFPRILIHYNLLPTYEMDSTISPTILKHPYHLRKASPSFTITSSNKIPFTPPVYYINLPSDYNRNRYMKQHLVQQGFTKIQKISAWTPELVEKYVTINISAAQNLHSKNNLNEIACIASHLYAMYRACNDRENDDSPYALIIEDDIAFQWKVNNWEKFFQSIPVDFEILQLTTSNSNEVKNLWTEYFRLIYQESVLTLPPEPSFLSSSSFRGNTNNTSKFKANPEHQWKERKWDTMHWSTQAYIINKQVIKEKLKRYIRLNTEDHHYHIQLLNPDPKRFRCAYPFGYICHLPFRIVADIFLYALFTPVYISRIPMINGAAAGSELLTFTSSSKESSRLLINETSSIDQSRIRQHEEEFSKINQLVQVIRAGYSHLLPEYFLA